MKRMVLVGDDEAQGSARGAAARKAGHATGGINREKGAGAVWMWS